MREKPWLRATMLWIAVTAEAPIAFGQALEPSSRNEIAQPGEPARDDDRAVATATPDPTPVPPDLDLAETPVVDVIEQAGVGGPVAFGSAGVLEVGGSGYFSGDDTELWAAMRPSVGLFVLDGVQLGISNEVLVRYGSPNDELTASLLWTVDANFYVPVEQRLWVQLGLGGGFIYNSVEPGGAGLGRAGLAILVGRSAILHFLATGGVASVSFAGPARAGAGSSWWRLGGEIGFGAIF